MIITKKVASGITEISFSSIEWDNIISVSAFQICTKISDLYVEQFSKEIIEKIDINQIKSRLEDVIVEEIKKISIKDIKKYEKDSKTMDNL